MAVQTAAIDPKQTVAMRPFVGGRSMKLALNIFQVKCYNFIIKTPFRDKDMKKLIAVMLLLGFGVVQAGAVTIDFNNIPVGNYMAGLDTEGFTFSGGLIAENAIGSDGMAYGCGTGNNCTVLAFEHTNGALFDLAALELAVVNAYGGTTGGCHDYDPANPIPCVTHNATLTGYTDSGSEYTYELATMNQNFGTPIFLGWTNLIRVKFSSEPYPDTGSISAFAMDSIVVSVIPIPATVWLFGSALAGLGWMRRRKTI
jgi:hypothetical protein